MVMKRVLWDQNISIEEVCNHEIVDKFIKDIEECCPVSAAESIERLLACMGGASAGFINVLAIWNHLEKE